MNSETDLQKARTLFGYLSSAAKMHSEREIAREKIRLQIQKLKKLSTKSLRQHIDELEKRLEQSIAKERELASERRQDDFFHESLRQKISHLEEKLGRYLETRGGRIRRIAELEGKIRQKTATRNEQVAVVLSELARLERIYREAMKNKKNKKISRKRLDAIRQRMLFIKDRVKAVMQ